MDQSYFPFLKFLPGIYFFIKKDTDNYKSNLSRKARLQQFITVCFETNLKKKYNCDFNVLKSHNNLEI